MKNLIITPGLLLTFISVAIISSCNTSVTGEGPVAEVKREAGKFSKVDLELMAVVYVTQSTANTIIIKSQRNIADAINTTISGKTLKIYSNKNLETGIPPEINITMNNLDELEVSGNGEIKCGGTVNAPTMKIKVSGSGKIYFNGVCNDLETNISGSGEIYMKGSVNTANHEISGSGRLFAYDLLSKNCKTEISGSGDAQVTASESLIAKISGSGNVSYKGSPVKLDTKVTGSGTIQKAQ